MIEARRMPIEEHSVVCPQFSYVPDKLLFALVRAKNKSCLMIVIKDPHEIGELDACD